MNFQIELVIREIQVCGFAQGKRFISLVTVTTVHIVGCYRFSLIV